MILKGLPEFFAYNREMSRLNRPLVTWREFQRLRANGLGTPGKPTQAVPLLVAPKYTKGHETPCTPVLEVLAESTGMDVHSVEYLNDQREYLEPEPLVLSPVTSPEETS